jgi:hypothetical protein
MRDINEILRKKEAALQQLQREVEALRIAARVLSEETEAYARPQAASSYASPEQPAAPGGGSDAGYSASWDTAGKKFP